MFPFQIFVGTRKGIYGKFSFMKAESAKMENLFLALADKTRLRLLNLMREDEVCVCYFTEVLGMSQPKISRHLAYLRSAGIVSARREGKWMNYKIDFPENAFAARLLDDVLGWLAAQREMRADYEKLAGICRDDEAPPIIVRAPTPKTFAQTNVNCNRKKELDTFLL